MKFPVLHTERLILREMQQKDKEQFINFMTNQSCTQYLMFSEEQKTHKGARRLFDYIPEQLLIQRTGISACRCIKRERRNDWFGRSITNRKSGYLRVLLHFVS